MAFRLKNSNDNSILHTNSLSEKDFDTPQLKDDWMFTETDFGKMKWKQWVFDGVRIGYSDWSFRDPVTLNWEGDLDGVTMFFSLKGGVTIGGENGNYFELGNNQQNMFYGSAASGVMKVDNLHIKSFMVQFNKEAFLRIAGGGTDELKYFADEVAGGRRSIFSPKELTIGMPSQNAIDAVMTCRYADPLKRIFFLSKVMELLVLQADAHMRMLNRKQVFIKSSYDRERILFAREYMMQHMDMPPSIPELAKITGINEFKLKKGYKEMFGNTIFGHLAEARLEKSKIALLQGEKSIAGIAFEMGYSSVQHFSAAFKKRYGIPPGQAKKSL